MGVYPSVLESSKSNFSQWWPENSTPFLLYLWASFSPHIMRLLCTYRSDGNFWDAASSAMRPIICRDQLWLPQIVNHTVKLAQAIPWLDFLGAGIMQQAPREIFILKVIGIPDPIPRRETFSLDFFPHPWSLLKMMMAFLITKAVKRLKQHETNSRAKAGYHFGQLRGYFNLFLSWFDEILIWSSAFYTSGA